MKSTIRILMLSFSLFLFSCSSSTKGNWEKIEIELLSDEIKETKWYKERYLSFPEKTDKGLDCYLTECEKSFSSYYDWIFDEDVKEQIKLKCFGKLPIRKSILKDKMEAKKHTKKLKFSNRDSILKKGNNRSLKKTNISKNEEFNEVKLITINQTENQINDYLTIIYDKFNDSINKTSGVLGWKNVRDYFYLGSETMKGKSTRVWYSIYDSIKVTNIVTQNLEDAYMSLGRDSNNIKVNYISGKEQVELYSHKVGLSIIANILEHLLELLVDLIGSFLIACIVVYGYVFYMFYSETWIRWSKKRHEKVDNLGSLALKWGGTLCVLIVVASMFFSGDLTENQLKNKIKKDILEQVENEIKINLK